MFCCVGTVWVNYCSVYFIGGNEEGVVEELSLCSCSAANKIYTYLRLFYELLIAR